MPNALLGASLTALLTLTVVAPSVHEVSAHDSPENHDWLDGCDRRADGLSARAWQHTPLGDSFPGSWDDNGANPGCANNYVGGFINSHRICVEQPVGCSGWRGS
jgi:hypothetical protein